MISLFGIEGHHVGASADVMVPVVVTLWIPVGSADDLAGEGEALAIDAVHDLGVKVTVGGVEVRAELA